MGKVKEATRIESVEALRSNIRHLKNVINELSIFLNQFYVLGGLEGRGVEVKREEKKLLNDTIISLVLQLRIINNSIPELVKSVSFFKELPKVAKTAKVSVPKKKEKLISLQYQHPTVSGKTGGAFLTIRKQDKLRFLKELRLTEESVRRLKKSKKIKPEKIEEFKRASSYAKISNKYFSKMSSQLIEKGYFKDVSKELRKANLYFLTHTYVSMALFTSVLSIIFAIILVGVFLFYSFTFLPPGFSRATDAIYLRFFKFFWLIFAIPVLTFLAFYFYPSTERKSIGKKIDQELPFVVIHMSAIAGSGVEPTKIFRIIVTSKQYKNTKKEFKKLLNEINVYGYDLITALRNIARVTSSSKLTELFNGLATTITSGGDLKGFLDKRAETLVFEYRMEREKYTKMAETFMDIYISVVIAAPMILTLMLVMMSMIPQISLGLSGFMLGLIIVMIIALINVVFLVFLHLRQPEGGS